MPIRANLDLGERGSKLPPTGQTVGDLPTLGAAVDRHVEFGFRCIYSCRPAILRHLRRPRLVERTLRSGNHPGPMKALTRSKTRGVVLARAVPQTSDAENRIARTLALAPLRE